MVDQIINDSQTSTSPDDWGTLVKQIVVALQSQDMPTAKASFDVLWKKANPWLLYRAQQKGLRLEQAEDVIVETFLSFWKILLSGEPVESVGGLLFKLLDLRTVDFFRKIYGRNKVADDEDFQPREILESEGAVQDWQELADPCPTDYEDVDEADFRMTIVNPILGSLSARERQALVLRHGFGVSVEQTALQMRLTKDQVKKTTVKALVSARAQADILARVNKEVSQ